MWGGKKEQKGDVGRVEIVKCEAIRGLDGKEIVWLCAQHKRGVVGEWLQRLGGEYSLNILVYHAYKGCVCNNQELNDGKLSSDVSMLEDMCLDLNPGLASYCVETWDHFYHLSFIFKQK
jgi:hypothetical protein